jgi:hypothetical protein
MPVLSLKILAAGYIDHKTDLSILPAECLVTVKNIRLICRYCYWNHAIPNLVYLVCEDLGNIMGRCSTTDWIVSYKQDLSDVIRWSIHELNISVADIYRHLDDRRRYVSDDTSYKLIHWVTSLGYIELLLPIMKIISNNFEDSDVSPYVNNAHDGKNHPGWYGDGAHYISCRRDFAFGGILTTAILNKQYDAIKLFKQLGMKYDNAVGMLSANENTFELEKGISAVDYLSKYHGIDGSTIYVMLQSH